MTDKSTSTRSGTKGLENGEPGKSNSGLDVQGNMRIGERLSIAARGEGLVLTQAHSGREVEVSETALVALLEKEYFVDHKD